jgi:hypothetical protein
VPIEAASTVNRAILGALYVNILVPGPAITLAGAWLGNASSATFYVRNPGLGYSNGVTVPLGYPPTVSGGTGSGVSAAGTVVAIAANAAPAGQAFTKWTGAAVASATSATATTIAMSAANTITTKFAGTKYTLSFLNVTGSGHYRTGAAVTIAANAAPACESFADGTGATAASAANVVAGRPREPFRPPSQRL